MKSCSNCLLPETHETITFKSSVCNICTNSKKKKNLLIGQIENYNLIRLLIIIKNRIILMIV